MADLHAIHDGLVVTAFWEAKPGEVDSVVEILKRFLPQAQREPGVKAFQIHQSLTEPQKFFFYEVFKDEAAFAEHQHYDHFKTLIAGQALPTLAKRDRTQALDHDKQRKQCAVERYPGFANHHLIALRTVHHADDVDQRPVKRPELFRHMCILHSFP